MVVQSRGVVVMGDTLGVVALQVGGKAILGLVEVIIHFVSLVKELLELLLCGRGI